MLKDAMQIRIRSTNRSTSKRLSFGLSIIELLIGVAMGLFILAGASAIFFSNITNARKLLLEAQINQDMRATMDLLTRDLRRSAYWGNSLAGTSASGSSSATISNPYSVVTSTGSTQINYAYTRDTIENNELDVTTEQFGFKLNTESHAIQMYIGGSWQTLTNTDILTIPDTGFTITPTETTIDIRAACAKICIDMVLSPSCPRVKVRAYNIVLTGISKTDSTVSRTLRSQVRVRNDAISGSCPA
jgi:type IV pilus assembly protein PilW